VIAKVLKLQGIGLLHDALDSTLNNKALPLGKFTVIYGENGRGKSTLAAILRSFSTGETSTIEERATIGGKHHPHVSFLVKNKPIAFSEGHWGSGRPDVVVFDTQFVESNVYSGMSIGPDQRKNLLEFALGEAGVKLAQDIDALNSEGRKLSEQISAAERDVALLYVGNIPLEHFLTLENRQDVDHEIEEAQKLWESVRQSQSIIERPLPRLLDVKRPSQEQAEGVLLASLASLSASTEAAVRQHNDQMLHSKGEQWLKKGLEYQAGDQCPYCGQDVSDIDLVKAYSGFFSREYAVLKKRTEEYRTECSRLLSEGSLLELTHLAEKNSDDLGFWRSYITADLDLSPILSLKTAWESLHYVLDQALSKKVASPLEDTGMLSGVREAFAGFEQVMEEILTCNLAISAINAIIAAFKDKLSAQDAEEAKNALTISQNRKARWTIEGDAACQCLLGLRKRKLEVEAEKARAKDELNQYTKTELVTYQEHINRYLQRSGTGFRIEEVKPAYGGGTARSDFKINVRALHVGTSEKGTGSQSSPSFRTALSDGDKRTLAFAFFVARLNDGADIAEKIIVFDDPIVSFDAHRRNLCIRTISQVFGKCAQVIVLTHDAVFAKSLSQEFKLPELCSLKIRRHGDFSVIEPCDLVVEGADHYSKNYTRLVDYIGSGPREELIDIVRCIRPLLEGNLRSRFPARFREDATLGEMIAEIRNAQTGDCLRAVIDLLSHIEEINGYVVPFHHDVGRSGEFEVMESELSHYAQRTINIVHGFPTTQA